MNRLKDTLQTDWIGWLNRLIWLVWAALFVAHLVTLTRFPGGLHYDEAFEGLDALQIGRRGFWPAFLPGNFGREPLMTYAMAASLRLLGNNVWALRLPVALAWGASLPALYWLIHELHPTDSPRRRVCWLIAAPLTMTSLWFAITAHYAIRVNWLVLLELLFLAALWRTWNTGGTRDALLAGILGGLCFYTYLPNRLLPILLGAMFLLALLWRRPQLRERGRSLAIVVLLALLVSLPLVVHFVRFPEDFLLRLSQVSLVETEQPSGAAATVSAAWTSGQRTAGMFFLHGDQNPRNNIPGRPALTWWSLGLFLLGLGAVVAQPRRLRGIFVLLWLLIMLVPTWLSEYAPSFQRAIGAFPPLVLLMAEGGAALWQWVHDPAAPARNRLLRSLQGRWGQIAVAAALAVAVLAESLISLQAFWQWQSMAQLFHAFDEGILEIGRYIGALPEEQVVYVTPLHGHPTLDYSLSMSPDSPQVQYFDGRRALVARPGQDSVYAVITYEDGRFEIMAPWLYPNQAPGQEKTFYDREGRPYAKIFRVPATARLRRPEFPAGTAWEDGVQLTGYDAIGCCTYRPGDRIYLELWWTADRPAEAAWTVFVHLLAPDGQLAAQDDGEPGGGSYPTTAWQTGEVIVDERQLVIPAEAAAGAYTLELGLYNWATGQRLPLADGSGDAARLGTITVE